MHTIAVVNQKGGCGKTTTAVNLSASLALKGYRVLLVDLDPQGHATLGVGLDPSKLDDTLYDMMLKPERSLYEIIKPTMIPHLMIAPSNLFLSGVDIVLANRIKKEKVVEEIFSRIDGDFQFVIFDCAPSLNLLTVNALNYVKKVLIPIQAHYYAMEGVKQLFVTLQEVKKRLNPDLQILGMLLTMVDKRMKICSDVARGVREYFKERVFNTMIRSNVRLTEAPSAGQPVCLYDPHSIGAQDYENLAHEILYLELGLPLPEAPPALTAHSV
jgi:chromosome partitioning protein